MDKNKIIQAATKFVQKGQFDKAISEYQKILKEDPKDVRILLKVGELYQKKGDNGLAATTLLAVAESYSADGFFLKAVAVYKQVLKLDPNLVEVNLKLAELYQQLGLMSDAMAQFQLVSNHYDRLGNAQASLDVLRRMVDLDPENVASRIKLAELYARDGNNGEAVEEFRKAGEYLKNNNRVDDYLKVGERIVFLDPNDIALTRELANVYLAKNDTKRALAKLQNCFKADPRDIETLHMLAQAFKDLGQLTKTVSVYKELAKIFGEGDRFDEEKATWRKVLEIAPDDEDARTALAPKRQQMQGPDDFPMAQGPRASAPASQPMSGGPPPGARGAPQTGPPPGARPSAAPAQGRGGGKDQIPKLLTETDVYVKYGLQDKALEHLKKIFAIDPDNVDAHDKAGALYAAGGNHQGELEELLVVARLCAESGDLERGRAAFVRLMEQAPHLEEVGELAAHYGSGMAEHGSSEPADDAILVEASDDEVLVADGEDESLLPRDHAGEEIVFEGGDVESELSLDLPGDEPVPGFDSGEIDAGLLELGDAGDSDVISLESGDDDVDAALDAAADAADDEQELASDDEISVDGAMEISEELAEPDEAQGDLDDAALEAAIAQGSTEPDEEPGLAAEESPFEEEFGTSTAEEELAAPLLEDDEPPLPAMEDDEIAPPSVEEEEYSPGPGDSGVHELPTQMMSAGSMPDLAKLRAQWKQEPPEEDSGDLPFLPPTDEEPEQPTLPGVAAARHTAPTAVGPSPIRGPLPELPPEPETARQKAATRVGPQAAIPVVEAPEESAEENPWGLDPEELEEIATELEEADFLSSQDLLDEAEDAYRSILFRAPGHPVAEAKLAEIEARKAGPTADAEPGGAEEPAAPAPDESDEGAEGRFDIGAELAEELADSTDGSGDTGGGDDFQYSVEDVFEEFKKGVSKTVKPEDTQTHYDLGIAYREMSLLRDAIGEFETALAGCRGVAREVDCLHMIGVIRFELGEHAESVASFKDALAAPAITAEMRKAIHFEIGNIYDKTERGGEALYWFDKVAQLDGTFRDVKKALERIRATGAVAAVHDEAHPRGNGGGNGSKDGGNGSGKDPDDGGPAGKPGGAGKSRKIGYV